jgi:hypothetical protein
VERRHPQPLFLYRLPDDNNISRVMLLKSDKPLLRVNSLSAILIANKAFTAFPGRVRENGSQIALLFVSVP